MDSKVSTRYHIFIGAPGAGKGYIGEKLKAAFDVKIFSSGELFRKMQKEGKLGEIYCDAMEKGDLIPLTIAMPIILEELSKPEWRGCDVILDGFPRTEDQAVLLELELDRNPNVTIETVMYLDSDMDLIKKRVLGRVSCASCGKIYNTFFKMPKVDGICDECGGNVTKRKDDNIEVYEHRVSVFEDETMNVMRYYECEDYFRSIQNIADGTNVKQCIEALEKSGVSKR